MQVRPLICILSPRDIPEVISNLNNITKYDKLWVKYYDNPDAHSKAKQYFLEHKEEYTHAVRVPDDILLREEHVDKLVSDLQKHHEIECISAVGNLHADAGGLEYYGVCMDTLPAKNKQFRKYDFIAINRAPTSGIYKVKFGGGYAAFFSRRLLEENIISWQTDLEAEVTKHHNKIPFEDQPTCCNDVVVSHELNEAGVGEYVDFGVVVKHLKMLPQSRKYFIGKKEAYIKLESKHN